MGKTEREVLAELDFQSTICGFIKEHIIQLCSQKPLSDINIEITNRVKSLMKLIAASTDQDTQAELMSYLSLALLGVQKHLIFRSQHYVNYQNSIIDYINWLKITMNKMPIDCLFKQINPLLFDLSELVDQTYTPTLCEMNEETGFEYPLTIELSYEHVGTKHLLLMDDGVSLCLVIMNYNADIINLLFQ